MNKYSHYQSDSYSELAISTHYHMILIVFLKNSKNEEKITVWWCQKNFGGASPEAFLVVL